MEKLVPKGQLEKAGSVPLGFKVSARITFWEARGTEVQLAIGLDPLRTESSAHTIVVNISLGKKP